MLADSKDESVVESDVCTLRLGDVKIMALCVGGGMKRQERVRRVGATVGDGETKGQRMRIEFVGVLKKG